MTTLGGLVMVMYMAVLTKPLECKPATISQKSVTANANERWPEAVFIGMDVNGRVVSRSQTFRLTAEGLE